MTANLPSKRYPIFIDAFEKIVATKQAEIKMFERGQPEYLACRMAMIDSDLPNDGKLSLALYGATINIVATPNDTRAAFTAIIKKIGAALVEARLHGDGVPSESRESTWYPDWRFSWATRRRDGSSGVVKLDIRIPDDGIRDMRVTVEKRLSEDTAYVLLDCERREIIDAARF